MEDFQPSTKKPRVSEQPTKSRFSEPTSDDCIKMSKLKWPYSQEHAKEQCVDDDDDRKHTVWLHSVQRYIDLFT